MSSKVPRKDEKSMGSFGCCCGAAPPQTNRQCRTPVFDATTSMAAVLLIQRRARGRIVRRHFCERMPPRAQQLPFNCGPTTVMNAARFCPLMRNFESSADTVELLNVFHSVYSQSPIGDYTHKLLKAERLHYLHGNLRTDSRRWLQPPEDQSLTNYGNWKVAEQFVGALLYGESLH